MTIVATASSRTHLTSAYAIGDRLTVDGDPHLVGVVTGFMWRSHGVCQVELSWFSNGTSQTAWVEEWRLKRGERRDA